MSPAVARLIVSRLLSLTSNTSAYLFFSYARGGCCSYARGELVRKCSEPRPRAGGVFLVGAALGPRQVDAERLGRAEGVFVQLTDLDLLALRVHHTNVEAQRLHLLDEHLERLGDAGLG